MGKTLGLEKGLVMWPVLDIRWKEPRKTYEKNSEIYQRIVEASWGTWLHAGLNNECMPADYGRWERELLMMGGTSERQNLQITGRTSCMNI